MDKFTNMILSGELEIGQRLPAERELALKLGVSRPVVHEGLVELSFLGLITLKPRFGSVINDFRKEGSLALLTSLLKYQDGSLSDNIFESMMDMRAHLEMEIARLATKNRSPEDIKILKEIIEHEKGTKPGDIDTLVQLDFDFHLQLALASKNLFYSLLMNSFKPVYTNLTTQFYSKPEVVQVVHNFHADLIEAIGSANIAKSKKIMKSLLDHGRKNVKPKITRESSHASTKTQSKKT